MSTTNNNLNEPQNLSSVAEVEDAKLAQIHEKPKSQGRIVFERFVSHKPAMISTIVLIFITVFAFSSIGWGPFPGWWVKSFYQAGAVIDGGKPTLSLVPTWLGG